MFAVIHLHRFALQAALRHEPELWAKPVALVDSALTTPRVCELTDPARTAGVEEGLTPTQALARCRDVVIRSRSLAQETAATESVLQCAYGFSPHIENTAPGTCTLDLRGLADLRNASAESLLVWTGRLRTALAALNLRARIGAGSTPNVARHAARWSEGLEIVSNANAFVAALPVDALDPSTDVSMILQKWGIRTVGELLALGQEALADRLGLEALALFAASSTTAVRPLNLVRPSERFEESFEFEEEVETIEPLLFILRRFVDQMSHRLELAGFVAELLTLRLGLESGEIIERRLRVPQPTRQADILFRMLHTHLETLRTGAPIVHVALRAEPTQPEQKQFGLFEAALRDPHQFQETLARLSALVGADRVGTPVRENSHRPDAFKMATPDFENAPSALVRRVPEILRMMPLRRFRPAVKASVECADGSEGQSDASLPLPMDPPDGRARLSSARPSRNQNTPPRQDERREGFSSANLCVRPVSAVPFLFRESAQAATILEDTDSAPRTESATPRRAEDRRALPNSGSGMPGSQEVPEVVTPAVAPRPLSIHCSVANGKLKIVVGPWRASGHWWEPDAWQREEWIGSAHDGQTLRLVRSPDGWFVEGIVD